MVFTGAGSGCGACDAVGVALATLGEEVRDPGRTIPRAIPIALGITVVLIIFVTSMITYVTGGLTAAGASASTRYQRHASV